MTISSEAHPFDGLDMTDRHCDIVLLGLIQIFHVKACDVEDCTGMHCVRKFIDTLREADNIRGLPKTERPCAVSTSDQAVPETLPADAPECQSKTVSTS